jgi:hypothetical protein
MTNKIVFSIFLFLTLSFSIFSIFQFTFSDSLNTRERNFYEQDFDLSKNNILLLGSSHVGQVNATHVNASILHEFPNSNVYNLAEASNHPSKRISTINEILKLNPSVVVYGIAYRDFAEKNNFDKDTIFPDPEKILHDGVSSIFSDVKFDFLDNPKLVTLNTIRTFMKTNISDDSSTFFKENTPFFPYNDLENNNITNNSKIEKDHDKSSINIKINLINNSEINSLEEMIKIFQQNNISVILFVTPHHKYYTDLIPDSEKTSFNLILNELSQKYNLKVYSLENKYSTLNIWSSANHVAHNPNSMIYSEDISKMILNGFD